MTPQAPALTARANTFVCPFCGLLCDDLPGPEHTGDLPAWRLRLQAPCPRAAAGLEALSGSGATEQPRIDGVPVSMAAALAEAALRIADARRPVIGGLGGDVQAMRAALSLGDRIGARMLHRNQFVAQRNLFALQSRGAMTTTLAEVKHRADMVILVGSDVTRAFPRLLERIFVADPAFVDAASRQLLLLGAPPPQNLPPGVAVESIACGDTDLFDSVALLRAHLRGKPLPAEGALADLARRMQASRYGVIVWAAADLNVAGADLLIEQLHQLVIELNARTRWAALPLAGNEGDVTANAVAAWQTGFALPIEFAAGEVAYDPFPDYSDADLLLWLGALPGTAAPQLPGAAAEMPQIVIGAPSLAARLAPRHVFFPVATPGVNASGHLVRTDSVITLYAAAVASSPLPSAAAVFDNLMAALLGDAA